MKLTKLIKEIKPIHVLGNAGCEIASLGFDSRHVTSEQLFFALKGELSDGHTFISSAIAKGAVAVVCERLPEQPDEKICYVQVADSHSAMGYIASAFYGHPSRKLKLVGITGTNGKTTTATLLYRLFRMLGYKTGLLSTVVNSIDGTESAAERTTPDALQIQQLIAEMVSVGCAYCFMEVSSHAIVQHRIAGLDFDGALFSNITHDHLDYHKTFDEYIKAKKLFFDELPATAFSLINVDDRNGRVMVQNTKSKVYTYALQTLADFNCRVVENTFDGLHLIIGNTEVWTRFIGRFNAYNMLAVYAAAQLLGVDKVEALRLLSNMDAVSGRFEVVRGKNNVTAIVDYAHTPDALQNVIDTINDIRNDRQRLITVVGCGGNRDKAKRPVMARIAIAHSDTVVFTSDNPRNENPDAILDDMYAGLAVSERTKAIRIVDRKEAINAAVHLAHSGDIILIAGKGHEAYQEIKGVCTHFDDKEIIKELLIIHS